MKIKRTERGWAGHFICGSSCHFRRNTLLERGKTRLVVSTVGAMKDPRDHMKFDTIGCQRYYETMVFLAKWELDTYWDADVYKGEMDFDSPWSIDHIDEKTDKEANDLHEKVVDEFTRRLSAGEKFKPRE